MSVLAINSASTPSASDREQSTARWLPLAALRMPLRVHIALPGMSIRQVRALAPGDVLMSRWPASEEVPLHAGGVALSWCEFEVVDDQMAVRLTRLG